MASSKEVLAVLGNLCISRRFRKAFFENPQATAESLVGRLRPDELEQILALAGLGKLPSGMTREIYTPRFKEALDQMYTAMTCPTPPCPDDPDSDPPKA